MLEQTQYHGGVPRPGRPGNAVPGDGPAAPPTSICTEACECCYYTLSRTTADGYYTCGWRMIQGRHTWWHARAAHGMWDSKSPGLGINKPGVPQCACCYYRMVGGAWTGPGWFRSWRNNQHEYVWYGTDAPHRKPYAFWSLLEYDRDLVDTPGHATPGGNVAPEEAGSSTEATWWDPADWMTAGAMGDALAPAETPEMPGDEPILEDDDDDEPITLTLEYVLPFADPQFRSLSAVTGEEPILEEQCQA